MPKSFEEENNQLFRNLIHTIEKEWHKPYNEQKMNVEFCITPECNQQCEYCYLQKHKDELYPLETRNKDTIIKNLKILLQYYLDNNFQISRLDLFSGEIFGFPFGNQILDIILSYIQQGLSIEAIFIPTNGSFACSEKIINIMQYYIDIFKVHNTLLSLSISYDGPYLDAINRPVKSKIIIKDDIYLKRLANFMLKNKLGFHPMISSATIEDQIKNYDSWLLFLKKYMPEEYDIYQYGKIMQLETREHGWTNEKIISYLKWLKYIIDTDYNYFFNNDKESFNKIVCGDLNVQQYIKKLGLPHDYGWSAYFPYYLTRHNNSLGCTLGYTLMIRLGDLAIIPCHRTSYPKFILGYYKVENDKIIDVICNNFPLASAIFVSGFKTKPICNICPLNSYCVKYCLGANYEQNQELFYPEEDNCKLQKAKFLFLIIYYKSLGFEIPPDFEEVFQILSNPIDENEKKEIKKWITIIHSII